MFRLLSLTIGEDCASSLRKNLQSGVRYDFVRRDDNDEPLSLPENFFGQNIHVQAVLGKNGAGKSSLLEMIYRIINNFSKCHIQANRPASEPLVLVKGVDATLEFEIDGERFTLKALPSGQVQLRDDNNVDKVRENITETEVKNVLLNDFFYTVVNNYSLQAFNSDDYREEPVEKGSGDRVWIDSLFHKNDGYLVPLVLTPFRNEGNFSLRKETTITRNNLISLLLHSQLNNRQFIDGYWRFDVYYTLDRDGLRRKFGKETEWMSNAHFYDLIRGESRSDNIFSMILKAYDISLEDDNDILLSACVYLAYKTMSVAGTYPAYAQYADKLGDPWKMFQRVTDENMASMIASLVKDILADPSHITFKITQTREFLEKWSANSAYITENVDQEKGFSFFKNYIHYIGDDIFVVDKDIAYYKKHLPPSIFRSHLYLYTNRETTDSDDGIPFYRLSSGERQMIFMLANIFTHVLNISSVKEERPHYRNINIIIDEIELSFHPEYQRQIVNKLIDTIKRLHLNTNGMSFNILITTHSPFVLSDIPAQNILALENGHPSREKLLSFGANIHDMLKSSFFLESSIGEYAKKIINEIIRDLNAHIANKNTYVCNNSLPSKEQLDKYIDIVDEKIINHGLRRLFNEAFGESAYDLLIQEIAERETQLEKLRQQADEMRKPRQE